MRKVSSVEIQRDEARAEHAGQGSSADASLLPKSAAHTSTNRSTFGWQMMRNGTELRRISYDTVDVAWLLFLRSMKMEEGDWSSGGQRELLED